MSTVIASFSSSQPDSAAPPTNRPRSSRREKKAPGAVVSRSTFPFDASDSPFYSAMYLRRPIILHRCHRLESCSKLTPGETASFVQFSTNAFETVLEIREREGFQSAIPL